MRWIRICKVPDHLLYIPDIALSDYYLLNFLSNGLWQKSFSNEDELNQRLENFFVFKPKLCYRDHIENLPKKLAEIDFLWTWLLWLNKANFNFNKSLVLMEHSWNCTNFSNIQ